MPNLPEHVNFHHPIEQVARVIQLLDLSNWSWTVQDILSMPEAWADDLITARYCGWILAKSEH